MSTSLDALLGVVKHAIERTSESITITDPHLPDAPLIYANPAFYRVTGYSPEETLGRNCRFLQGPDTDPQTVATIRRTLEARKECVVELLNYRKDGTPWWNRLSLLPMLDPDGTLTHFVGFQSDLTAEYAAAKAAAQLEALQATMQTVNDLVRNFMSNIDYFQFKLEASGDNDPETLTLYKASVAKILTHLDTLSSAQEYRERELFRGIKGIDLAYLAHASKQHDA